MGKKRLTVAEIGDVCTAMAAARQGYLMCSGITAADQDLLLMLRKAETLFTDAAVTLIRVLEMMEAK